MNNEEKDLQNELTIKIVDARLRITIQAICGFMCFIGVPIALGIFLDNTVMQWFGLIGFLVFCFLEMIVASKKVMEKVLIEKGRLKRFTAIDDAVEYLQSRQKQNH